MAMTTRSSTIVKAQHVVASLRDANASFGETALRGARSGNSVAMLGCFLSSIAHQAAGQNRDEQLQHTGRLWDGLESERGGARRRVPAEVCPPVRVIGRIDHARRIVIG